MLVTDQDVIVPWKTGCGPVFWSGIVTERMEEKVIDNVDSSIDERLS